MNNRVLSGWQTKQNEDGNVMLSFQQEKIQKDSWKMLLIYATLGCFVLIWEATDVPGQW